MRAANKNTWGGSKGMTNVRNSSENERALSEPRAIDIDPAILSAPLFRDSDSPGMAEEIFLQFRLLYSAIQVKLNPFYQGRVRFGDNFGWDFRLARRRP